MQVDFVTVTFSRDFNLLKLQARSIVLYVPESFINSIILICNDSLENMERLKTYILPEYKHLAEKVKIIDSTLLYIHPNSSFSNYGWFPQQILKLKAYKVATSKYYIVLDSKNHFIRPITEDYFFQDGKPLQVIEDYKNHFMRMYIINTLNVFENNKNNIKDQFIHYYTNEEKNVPAFQTLLTPVIFIKDICEKIDESIKLDYYLNGQHTFAEFAIYAAYIKYNDLQDEYIQTRQRLCFTEPNNTENWIDILKLPIDEQPYALLGVCVERLHEFTDEQLQLLKNRWVSSQLCTDDEYEYIYKIYTTYPIDANKKQLMQFSNELF
jgi:hypothetical protein